MHAAKVRPTPSEPAAIIRDESAWSCGIESEVLVIGSLLLMR